jgi:N-acetylmuramoyl-L-alanine amidase
MLKKKIKSLLVKFLVVFTLTVGVLVPSEIHNNKTIYADSRPCVVLDFGHRDTVRDYGATAFGLKESDIAEEIGKKVTKNLEGQGYRVVLTRKDENDIKTLSDRVRIANQVNPIYYISLHANSCANENTGTGIETFIDADGGNARVLADTIQKNLVDDIGLTDRGVKVKGFYTKNIKSSSVLVEMGFINNQNDAEKLVKEQDIYARSISYSIDRSVKYIYEKK